MLKSPFFGLFMSKDTDKPIDDFAADEATGHSDYKPTDTHDANAKHQLSGMYENWFLDYASYVILERAVPHIIDYKVDFLTLRFFRQGHVFPVHRDQVLLLNHSI